ncbi:unnamed protein product [Schistosoma mattheei]|uniref:Uncharacterized protein n=1 Tax=Schistosoma mattheei TaxID=31246 RepID=A0A183P211_9TREM|nr:unnamed protein product [Schistosoma mattheei]
MTEEDIEDVNIVAHFLTLIGVEAYSLIKAYPDKPISLRYATLNELLLDHVKCTKFECGKEENFRKMICQGIKNYTTLLRRPILMRNQGYSDNNSLRSCRAGHEDEHEFGKCSFYGKFRTCNSYVVCNSKLFKCDMIG